jgi:hypothetical protein
MKILKNCSGQVSIEFIILIGAIVVMVVAVFPYITRANELSKAHAAARDGATFAVGMRGMGYKPLNDKELPPGVVKITKVEMVKVGNYNGLVWYRFNISVYAPDYIADNSTYGQSLCGTIINQALQYIYYAFNGRWSDNSILSRVNTSHYSFTATCTFE